MNFYYILMLIRIRDTQTVLTRAAIVPIFLRRGLSNPGLAA